MLQIIDSLLFPLQCLLQLIDHLLFQLVEVVQFQLMHALLLCMVLLNCLVGALNLLQILVFVTFLLECGLFFDLVLARCVVLLVAEVHVAELVDAFNLLV